MNQHDTSRPQKDASALVDAVVIGRNEGERLRRCLTSLSDQVRQIVYVDSGSTDGSVAMAQTIGADIVELSRDQPFTAARARNAGYRALPTPPAHYVQFVDGDCGVDPDWVSTATRFLEAHPKVAAVCGRRRETAPEQSVYNRLCDREWNTPVGQTKACGGDALYRRAVFDDVGGFRDDLIAGEEPELCIRIRQAGWKIWRLDAEMTRHDAAIHRFGQWWSRTRRAGYAFAEGAAMNGDPPERHWVMERRRALLWGAILPAAILAAGILFRPAFLLLLLYPLQIVRVVRRGGIANRAAWEYAAFTLIGKFPEALGVLTYMRDRLRGRKAPIIEYK